MPSKQSGTNSPETDVSKLSILIKPIKKLGCEIAKDNTRSYRRDQLSVTKTSVQMTDLP